MRHGAGSRRRARGGGDPPGPGCGAPPGADNVYAHGTSEEFIGASLKNLGVPRADVVLASKVYFNEGHLSRAAIEREIDGTLERLGTDYLDLDIIHRFDYATPIEETMEALDSLVRSGRVRALGASAMYAYQLHNMQVVADVGGWTRFSSMKVIQWAHGGALLFGPFMCGWATVLQPSFSRAECTSRRPECSGVGRRGPRCQVGSSSASPSQRRRAPRSARSSGNRRARHLTRENVC